MFPNARAAEIAVKTVREYKRRSGSHMNLIRLNLNEAIIPEKICDRAVGINADMKKSIRDLYEFIHL